MHILFITPPKKKQEFVDPQKTIGVRTDLYLHEPTARLA